MRWMLLVVGLVALAACFDESVTPRMTAEEAEAAALNAITAAERGYPENLMLTKLTYQCSALEFKERTRAQRRRGVQPAWTVVCEVFGPGDTSPSQRVFYNVNDRTGRADVMVPP